MLAIGFLSASAQDVIVKKDGSTVLCKIIGVSDNEVIYTKWSDPNGAQYIMDRTLVSNLNYQDGRQEKLNDQTSNAYAPGNQQTGAANYNDKALLALDFERNGGDNNLKKAKQLKTIGWAVGAGGAVLGATIVALGCTALYDAGDAVIPIGSVIVGGGVATLIGCLVKAHQFTKQAQLLAVSPLINHEFNFKDGSSLCAGIDMIRDKRISQPTLGLGLQYTF